MLKHTVQMITLVVLGLFVYGCGSSGIRMTAYTEDKPRIDQEIGEGNAGYLMGTPQAEDRSQYKDTRKTYVLEISAEPGDIPPAGGASAPSTDDSMPSSTKTFPAGGQRQGAISTRMDVRVLPSQPKALEAPVTYTVEKDDTLQKISKKFYNTHGKWAKIYEANKSAIKNPDRIKPGTVIQIPME